MHTLLHVHMSAYAAATSMHLPVPCSVLWVLPSASRACPHDCLSTSQIWTHCHQKAPPGGRSPFPDPSANIHPDHLSHPLTTPLLCMCRLARLQHLMERRPELLSSVMLRQNPHNVHEWHKRVKLFEGNAHRQILTYTEAVTTVDPEKVGCVCRQPCTGVHVHTHRGTYMLFLCLKTDADVHVCMQMHFICA